MDVSWPESPNNVQKAGEATNLVTVDNKLSNVEMATAKIFMIKMETWKARVSKVWLNQKNNVWTTSILERTSLCCKVKLNSKPCKSILQANS